MRLVSFKLLFAFRQAVHLDCSEPFMYRIHPSQKLNELFSTKPYQGVSPFEARFLFIGLDANYDAIIESSSIFDTLLEYHDDGVGFWLRYGVHHPFLLPQYTGDGKFYHRSFARIGFNKYHAKYISFAELLDVPTVGRNKLSSEDLNVEYLKMLNAAILEGAAEHIFVSAGVVRLMRSTGLFPWLPATGLSQFGGLDILHQSGSKTVYSHLHFSVYGKFEKRKLQEAESIRELIENSAR